MSFVKTRMHWQTNKSRGNMYIIELASAENFGSSAVAQWY